MTEPLKISVTLHDAPNLMEVTFSRGREHVAVYVRDHTTTIVRETDGQVTMQSAEGFGLLNRIREILRKGE